MEETQDRALTSNDETETISKRLMNAPLMIQITRKLKLDRRGRRRLCRVGSFVVSAIVLSLPGKAQTNPVPSTESPRNLVVETSNNEIRLIQHPDSYLRYRYHVVDEKGDQLRDQIETPDGSVARLLQRNGKPLTSEEDQAERDRLKEMLNSPDTFERHIRREKSNKEMGVRLIKMMPDAMLWSYTPGQPQPADRGPGGSPLVVLDFKPNPKFSPPTIDAEPLTGLEGRVWIDPQSRRVVQLEGEVVRAVNIGWGMVAHIYPGGTVKLRQTNAGGQRWIVQHILEQLTVRALMVKTIKQQLIFDTSDYVAVPPMKYQDAIKLLLDTPLPK